jgi:hypothetical protein
MKKKAIKKTVYPEILVATTFMGLNSAPQTDECSWGCGRCRPKMMMVTSRVQQTRKPTRKWSKYTKSKRRMVMLQYGLESITRGVWYLRIFLATPIYSYIGGRCLLEWEAKKIFSGVQRQMQPSFRANTFEACVQKN